MRQASTVYFGQTAQNYDRERVVSPIWQQENDTIAPVLRSALRPADRVLDVAAGTGRWLDVYAAVGVHAILLDVSSDMLGTAREQAEAKRCAFDIVEGNIFCMSTLPACDWLVSTRFFNWIPLRGIETLLRLAVASGITRFAFTARCLDQTASLQRQAESSFYWHKKNFDVIRGARMKGIYYLHSPARLRRVLTQLGLEVSEEHVIERVRGDAYTLFIVTTRVRRAARIAVGGQVQR
jgi:SAM-dependent methyltransferase